MKKERNIEDAHNLKNIDHELYLMIDKYGISQKYLAEHVFDVLWKEAEGQPVKEKEKLQRMLAGRMRNKILGFGNLKPEEYSKLQQVMADIADDMQKTVYDSITKRNLERKEKIKRLLDNLDDDSLDELLNKR